MARAKGWMFTINNPGDDDRPAMYADVVYCCYQLERGEAETPHYQGYVLFAERKRMNQVARVPFLRRAHLEVRRGTNAEAIAYCSKEETRAGPFVEIGERPEVGQGKKKILDESCKLVRAGVAVRDMPEEFDAVRVRNGRGLRELQADLRRKEMTKFRHLDVKVLWGPTGVGKTRYAYEHFGMDQVYVLNQPAQGTNVWFDGYDKQRCLLIDDFEGWIPYRYLLKLLDGYPMELAVKGSFVPALYESVVITSNNAPEDWYREWQEMGAVPAPLARRISSVMHITEPLFPAHPDPPTVVIDSDSEDEGAPLARPSPKRRRTDDDPASSQESGIINMHPVADLDDVPTVPETQLEAAALGMSFDQDAISDNE